MNAFLDGMKDDRYGYPNVSSIESCMKCGYMATFPRLLEGDLPALYSKYYPRKEVKLDGLEAAAQKSNGWFSEFSRFYFGTGNQGQYFAVRGQKVLDVGAGSCLSLLEMRNRGILCWGLEADPNVARISSHFGLNVHIGSIFEDPFRGQKFDLIILNQVIEHVPDPDKFLLEVSLLLEDGGHVIISCPNTDSLLRRLSGRKWIHWHVPFHQHHFNLKAIKKLCIDSGFELQWLKTITPSAWIELQILSHFSLAPGRWVPSQPSKQKFFSNIFFRVFNRITRPIFMFFLFLIGRSIDYMGIGDSLVFSISPAKRIK